MVDNPRRSKIFGIGMSKTGTTSLGRCYQILGFFPHKSADRRLKEYYLKTGNVDKLIKVAEKYYSFEDTPWYLAYKELDQAFPGSKFILTVRKNSLVHAKSSWAHGVRAGVREGNPTEEYLRDKIELYEGHNRRVMEHFKNRPEDLLMICWEDGDGWEKLCAFFDVPVPDVEIPHSNKGVYKKKNIV